MLYYYAECQFLFAIMQIVVVPCVITLSVSAPFKIFKKLIFFLKKVLHLYFLGTLNKPFNGNLDLWAML